MQMPTKQPLVVLDSNRDTFEQVSAWMLGLPEYRGDHSKGIILIGHPGSGKTHLMKCISWVMRDWGRGFPGVPCDKITMEYSNTEVGNNKKTLGGESVIKYYSELERLDLEDVMREGEGSFYGQRCRVIEKILENRGDNMWVRPLLTMMTSNVNVDEWTYGPRAMDRVKLMGKDFALHPPESGSFRKGANVLDWRK